MGHVGDWVGLAWIVGLLGGVAFLMLYGSPTRYVDRVFSWHLFWSTLAGVLHLTGLLLSSRSLWPLLVADWLSAAIIYWRVGLLIASRRNRRRETPTKGVDHVE